MPTLLLLGGSKQQVVAIDTAKRLGCRTILCDYLDDNPGQHHADAFYLVSTTDKDAVLEIAKREKIDGVIAYASDPAAPTAAYVAEKLGLPGLPYSMAMNFCEKHLFRKFLSENGFNVPRSVEIVKGEPLDEDRFASLHLPVVVKPTDSSGSKGVTVVRDAHLLHAAIEEAWGFSRNDVLIVEEFIERDHPHVIEAELIVHDGAVKTWGIINSIRDAESNPLLPAAYSFPLEVTEEQRSIVEREISALVKASGMKSGSFNIEMIIDKTGRLFFLDAGPRNGGNMLPDYISLICGGDVVEAAIKNALGWKLDESICLDVGASQCWGLVVLHSPVDFTFEGLRYSDLARRCLVKEVVFAKPGDRISAFKVCTAAFGFVFLKFDSEKEKRDVMNHLEEHVWLS